MWVVYHCYTGMRHVFLNIFMLIFKLIQGSGSQMADVSWWPLPLHWNNLDYNGFNWGHWTEWDELWYQRRVEDILSSHKFGVPLGQTKWKSRLKGSSAWRQVTRYADVESKQCF